MVIKRFELFSDKDTWSIIDYKESKEIGGLVIYNDLGNICFSSAPQLCDLLNLIVNENNDLKKEIGELEEEIARQKYTKHIMRDNIKDYERAIKRLRKSFEEFDEMRLDRIRFLENRLKKNGLSIYINDCGGLDE